MSITIIIVIILFVLYSVLNSIEEDKKEKKILSESLELGIEYFNTGQYKKAISELKKILKKDENSPDAHFFLGLSYYKIGEYNKGSNHILTAVIVYENQKAYSKAITALHKIPLNKLPSDKRAITNLHLGVNYYATGDLEKAIHYYTLALKEFPNLSEAHYGLGIAFAQLGDMEQAWHHLKILKDLNPSLADELFKIIS